ncbi:MAG: M48 family metalloprotease [Gammaproteobacteria bacterium]|nr:M48 family metalloprotease [Gammaproteobacteria bacterium]
MALVIAHELAHNTMKHLDAQKRNVFLGRLVDAVIEAGTGVDTGIFGSVGGRVYSKEFEAEADYVGLYIMARAGLPINHAADFWRRMAAEHPDSINQTFLGTHPATPERFIALEHTQEEIQRKQNQGLQLFPEFKR